MKKLDVVKSRTAPLRDSLWIKDNRLKTIGPNGWEDIGGNSEEIKISVSGTTLIIS